MRYPDNGQAQSIPEVENGLLDVPCGGWVKGAGGFVEQ
jgi:hypothetical protein